MQCFDGILFSKLTKILGNRQCIPAVSVLHNDGVDLHHYLHSSTKTADIQSCPCNCVAELHSSDCFIGRTKIAASFAHTKAVGLLVCPSRLSELFLIILLSAFAAISIVSLVFFFDLQWIEVPPLMASVASMFRITVFVVGLGSQGWLLAA